MPPPARTRRGICRAVTHPVRRRCYCPWLPATFQFWSGSKLERFSVLFQPSASDHLMKECRRIFSPAPRSIISSFNIWLPLKVFKYPFKVAQRAYSLIIDLIEGWNHLKLECGITGHFEWYITMIPLQSRESGRRIAPGLPAGLLRCCAQVRLNHCSAELDKHCGRNLSP